MNATTIPARTDQALQVLRNEDGTTAVQVAVGGPGVLYAPEVLQPRLHGGVDGGADQSAEPGQQPTTVGKDTGEGVREVRINETSARSSQGREPAQQRPLEFGDVVRHLPYAYALAQMEGDNATAQAVRRVYEACPALGLVQHALQPVPASRRPAHRQEIQRAWEAGCFEGFGIVACNPLVKAFPSRVTALKGLGNCINPYVAAEFVTAYMECRASC